MGGLYRGDCAKAIKLGRKILEVCGGGECKRAKNAFGSDVDRVEERILVS